MTNLLAHQVREARAASSIYGCSIDQVSICSTQEEASAVMKTTNCPLCRQPKGHAKSHQISSYQFTNTMGLKTIYTKDTNQRLADYDKRKERAAKLKLQDEKDATTGANEGLVKKSDGTYFSAIETKKYNERQAKKKKIREETEAAGTIMGAGGLDAVIDKDKNESIKKNLDFQKPVGGAGRRVTGGLSRFEQSKEDPFGFSDVSTGVDAATAVNNVNTHSSLDYYQTVINSILSPLDRVTADGTVCKCISVA